MRPENVLLSYKAGQQRWLRHMIHMHVSPYAAPTPSYAVLVGQPWNQHNPE